MSPTSHDTGAASLNLPSRYMVLHQAAAQVKAYKADAFWKWIGVSAVCVLLVASGVYLVIVQNQLADIVASTRKINVTLAKVNKAYIISGTAQLDEFNGTLSLPLRNTGRMPSGQIVVAIHTATVNAVKPHQFPAISAAIGYNWQRRSFNSLVPGESQEVSVQLQKFSPKRVVQALQMIVIGGQIVYNDGFPEDQLDRRSFCIKTISEDNGAQVSWSDCNPEVVLPQMVALDGYPNSLQSR